MVRFGPLVSALSLLLSPAVASQVLDLDPSNFDSTVFNGVPSLVEFFAPWCGHCKKLAPIYDELADSLGTSSNKKKVQIAKVDADEHKSLGTKYGITGFPTIKYFDGKDKEPVETYSGARDLESLQKYIEEKTNAKAKKTLKPPSDVTWLTDQTWNATVGKDKDVFVAFTTSWCGHCKNLAPIWETLATDFSSDKVLIAKVDCEASKNVAMEQAVKSYPTIKFFPAGSTDSKDYDGARDEKSFIEYVNEQAGTHRSVGGKLNAKAGTVEALDNIIAKLSGGSEDIETIVKEAQKSAKTAKDKYAEYYVKVLNKLGQNKGYAEKELSRLEGMLKKGGLARNKEDDLISRSNVLRKFVFNEEKSEL